MGLDGWLSVVRVGPHAIRPACTPLSRCWWARSRWPVAGGRCPVGGGRWAVRCCGVAVWRSGWPGVIRRFGRLPAGRLSSEPGKRRADQRGLRQRP